MRTRGRPSRAAPSLSLPGLSPHFAAADENVEDRPDTPHQGDDHPDDLLDACEVAATEDVDQAQHEGDRVKEDRKQDLDQQFHDCLSNHSMQATAFTEPALDSAESSLGQGTAATAAGGATAVQARAHSGRTRSPANRSRSMTA